MHTSTQDRPPISIHKIEAAIADVVVTWSDKLRDQLNDTFGVDEGPKLFRRYRDVFPPGYQNDVSPRDACSDIERIEEMLEAGSLKSVDLYKPADALPGHMHFMIYSFGDAVALSEALPLLEDMGVDVYTEHPVSYTHLRAHETRSNLVCRLLLEKKK